jgi:hypothetical protein
MARVTQPPPQTPPHAGIGLRSPHYAEALASPPPVGFYELHAENFMCGGPQRRRIEAARCDRPVSLHGVGLSLGSDRIDARHLQRFADLMREIDPFLVSEHLAWSRFAGRYLNDLLPLPYTDEALAAVSRNVDRVQTRLRRPILIENPSRYLEFSDSVMGEAEFLAELSRRTGCFILCDVNNIYVTTRNLGGDPIAYLDALPAAAVRELHLAGHTVNEVDGVAVHIDDHASPVAPPVWGLYAHAVRRFPAAHTLIEWDRDLPPLATLVAEAESADALRSHVLAEAYDVAA